MRRTGLDLWWSDDDYERRREERRQYENDVFYEVWRCGGNPDQIDDDRVSDHYYDGLYSDEAASAEMRRMYPPEPPIQEEDTHEADA